MMKRAAIMIALGALLLPQLYAQTESIDNLETMEMTKTKKHNTFLGLSFEIGGGMTYDDDFFGILTGDQYYHIYFKTFELSDRPNIGVNAFVEQQFAIGERAKLNASLGLGITNYAESISLEFFDNYPSTFTRETVEIGSTNNFLSMDLALKYGRSYKIKKSTITPYIGLKARNVYYIFHEEELSNKSYSNPLVNFVGIRAENRMKNSRIVPLANIGVQVSISDRLALFADYNYRLDNYLSIRFDSFEIELPTANAFQNEVGLFAVDLSHFSTGITYRL